MNERDQRARARVIAAERGIGYQKALDAVAVQNGYGHWGAYLSRMRADADLRIIRDPAGRTVAAVVTRLLDLGEEFLSGAGDADLPVHHQLLSPGNRRDDDPPGIAALHDELSALQAMLPFEPRHLGMNLSVTHHPWRVALQIATGTGPLWNSYQSLGAVEHVLIGTPRGTSADSNGTSIGDGTLAGTLEAVMRAEDPAEVVDPTAWGFDVRETVMSDDWGRNDLFPTPASDDRHVAGVRCTPAADMGTGRVLGPGPGSGRQMPTGKVDLGLLKTLARSHALTRPHANEIVQMAALCLWGYSLALDDRDGSTELAPRTDIPGHPLTRGERMEMGAGYAGVLEGLDRAARDLGEVADVRGWRSETPRLRLSVDAGGIIVEAAGRVTLVSGDIAVRRAGR